MDIEYEATYKNINKDEIRQKLKSVGAVLIRSEFFQKRVVFKLPEGHEIPGGWLRVRDEGDKITMSLKAVDGDKIENQKEIYLKVSNFDQAVNLLETIGCKKKAFQENKREKWELEGCEVTIDEWPFLEPFVEVEGSSKEEVIKVTNTLGFNFEDALFCSVATLYHQKYGVSEDIINNKTPEILFDSQNPFLLLN